MMRLTDAPGLLDVYRTYTSCASKSGARQVLCLQ